MSSAQISPISINSNPAHVNPQVKAEQPTSAPQVSQDSQKTVKVARTDTVTISAQALQKLASDGDSKAKEIKKKDAEKVTETFRRKA